MTRPAANPFRPTFGVSPRVLAGRRDVLEEFALALAEGPGSPQRAMLVSGARGMGKTVLLNELEDAARSQGWVVVRARPHEAMIRDLVDTDIPLAIRDLDQTGPAAAGRPTRRVTGIEVAGLGAVHTTTDPGTAPTPTVFSALRDLGALTARHGAGVLITLDEAQAADPEQLHLLSTAIQGLARDELDIAFVAAGLPHGIDELLRAPGTTFLRRAERVTLGRVSPEEAADAFSRTAGEGGLPMSPAAARLAASRSEGYPYLMQLLGSMAWARARLDGDERIDEAHLDAVHDRAVDRLGRQVHEPALGEATDRELELLIAMARLSLDTGGGPVATGDLAAALGTKPNGISMARRSLLDKELLVAPSYGHLDFALPYLAEFLDRSPELGDR